jgi:hypothetical protein
MVKNTIGGKKGKMLANKRSGSGGDKKLRLSMNIDEIYVCVSKVFGSGMFEVIDNNGKEYKAHLRGKMKGPNKRHNFVSLFSFLLVGLRSDLSDSTNCDILFVYDDHDVLSLSLLPNLNLANLINFHHNHCFNQNNTNDLFGVILNESVIMDNNGHEPESLEFVDSENVDFSFY